MDFEINDGFNLVYAKSGKSPKNIFFENRKDVVNFFIDNINDIEFLSINDVIIDKNKLVNNNLLLSRYLKLKRIYEV
jgi:uncharacterized protein YneR